MTRMRITLIVSSLTIVVLLMSNGALCEPEQGHATLEPVTIAIDTWPPYITKTDQYEAGGFATEVVQRAFAVAGIRTKVVFSSWTRSIEGIKHGDFTASYPWYDLPERREFALFSETLCNMQYAIFYRKDLMNEPVFETLADLQGYDIAALRGTIGEIMLKDAGLNGLYPINADLCFRMLVAGRVDMVLENLAVGRDIIRNDFPKSEKIIGTAKKIVRTDPGYLIVSKQHPDAEAIVRSFNKGLRMLHESGEYEMILKAHHVLELGM